MTQLAVRKLDSMILLQAAPPMARALTVPMIGIAVIMMAILSSRYLDDCNHDDCDGLPSIKFDTLNQPAERAGKEEQRAWS